MSGSLKEAEIRPDALLRRYLELSRQDVARFFADENDRAAVPCPGCGEDSPAPAFTKHGFQYVQCRICFSLYVSPRPPADALDRFYADGPSSRFWANEFFPAVADSRRERVIRPRVHRVLARCEQEGISTDRMLAVDAGAGAGVFLAELREAAPRVQCVAIEPGRELAQQARANGLEVVEKTVEAASELAARGDLVTSFEVIEHIHNPLEFVTALRALAKPGGLALVTGLGGDGFDVQTLWESSTAVTPPHHLNFLSLEGFERLFARAGFTDVAVETPGQLDVELVQKAVDEGRAPELDRFVALLLERRGPEVHEAFQQFLQVARLSSHTWIWGRAPGGDHSYSALAST
jgi:SAM-dependent methyltransferase